MKASSETWNPSASVLPAWLDDMEKAVMKSAAGHLGDLMISYVKSLYARGPSRVVERPVWEGLIRGRFII